MGDSVRDMVGNLAHHAYDAVTGALSAASSPSKPAATVQDASGHLGTGLAQNGADTIKNYGNALDKQIADAGG